MLTGQPPLRSLTLVLAIATLLGSAVAASRAQGVAAKPQPNTQTSAAAAAPAAAPDGGWPRFYTTRSGAALEIYQPQVSSWVDQKRIVMDAAVSYTPKGTDTPTLGTVRVESDTSVALDQRLVQLSALTITQSNFPTLARPQAAALIKEVTDTVPLEERVIALDRVIANVDASQISAKNVAGVKADPPPIFFSKTPAVLVNIDGEPIWAPIAENDLSSAVNTNWDLFQHGPTKQYYLRNDHVWMKATDLQGPWAPAGALPSSFAKLPNDENWKDVKASLPGQSVSRGQAPKVFVSRQPAELLLLRGEPTYASVEGTTDLLWVSNTDSDVFRKGRAGPVYILISGRWFSAPDFSGPWTFATPQLPEDFKRIPLEHDRSRVLASVPGTPQAAEAILLAQIPQTASVSRTLQAPAVEYFGDTPEFQPIEQTPVQRAVNSDKDILKVGDLYYMCFQGVWFMSRTPTGPWQVTADVPKTIYQIPVSSPSHTVTYVTVQQAQPTVVVFAAAPGYSGVMVAWGCVVWGSGYYYPPYVRYRGRYPVYYPYYPTYGFRAVYNPWRGTYVRGAVHYGPYGGAGAVQRYNPRTGTYSRGSVAWGPYGASGVAQAYNPRTGAYGTTRQGSNVYGSWGTTSVQRGDQWATTSRNTNNQTGRTTRVTQGSQGGAAISSTGRGGNVAAGRTGSGDVYAGRDGNVYRKQGDSWQKYDGGAWSTVPKPTPNQPRPAPANGTGRPSGWDPATAQQVTRDSAARTEGAQRTRDAAAAGSASRTGSYRPSAGGRGRGRKQ